jgi:phosphatidylserine/phosphatidylglycerophosphate/cardiolipin synthase-like enzyme
MSGRSTRQRSILSSILGVLGLVVVAILWLTQGGGGADENLSDLPEPTPAGAWRRATGDWYELYLTIPQEAPTWTGGLDEVLTADMDGARRTIDIAAYDFDLESLTAALIRAHERGVQVRMVIDSDNAELDQVLDLIDAGIPVVEDGRSAIMHDKFVVIDSTITWTGSWNLTDNGTYRNNNNALRIQGPEVATNYGAEFEEMFEGRAFGPGSPAETPYPVLVAGESEIRTLFAPEDDVMEAVIAAVAGARESIRFMAYSFTDDALGAEMAARAAAGVLVEGVFEARTAESEYSQYGPLEAAGAQVWKDGNSALMHHKVIIIDRATVISGSFNYSASADESNDENLLIITDAGLAAEYLGEFERVVGEAR